MKSNNELEKYLSNGIEKIVKGIFKASVTNPKSSLFMMKHMIISKKSRDKRKNAEIFSLKYNGVTDIIYIKYAKSLIAISKWV